MVTNLTTGCISDTMSITTSVAEKPTLECITNTYDFCENTSITITESGGFNSVLWNDGLTINPRVFTQAYDGYISRTGHQLLLKAILVSLRLQNNQTRHKQQLQITIQFYPRPVAMKATNGI